MPKSVETGGDVVVSDSDIVQFCTRLEQDQANKTGTMVRATKNFLKWNSGLTYGGRRNKPSQLQLVLENGPHRVAASRAAHCKRLLQRRKELETEETQLHASLDQQVGSVLKDKHILLWRELLVETDYADLDMVDEVLGGIK